MITLNDLETAIAKCQGEENPNAQTCIKLAAYYTIREAMYGGPPATAPMEPEQPSPQYSYDPGPEAFVAFDGRTKFAEAVQGLPAAAVWSVMEELMDVLGATNQRLYDGVMRELQKI